MNSTAPPENAVEVKELSYTFLGRPDASLADLSLSLAPGTWTLLAGRTGSGKSTLLRALSGLIPRHAAGVMRGTVRLFGHDTRLVGPQQLARLAGLVLQSPDEQLCTATAESEVAFGLANLCLSPAEIDARITEWLDRLGLAACRGQSPQTLSGGQKQRLLLASILAMGPRLLLLDEPLAQLDGTSASDLLERLELFRQAGLSIVVAEHRLDALLPKVDRVLVLDRGRLVADRSPQDPELTSTLRSSGLIVDVAIRPAARILAPLANPDSAAAPVARVFALAMRYPSQRQPLWHNVQFEIQPGECVGIVGPNGCGKSTLLHVLAGLTRPTSGAAQVAHADPAVTPLALVPQNPDLTLFCRTVYDELVFGPRARGLGADEAHRRALECATALALGALLDEPPLALSQGQRMRVAVAATLALRPRLLLLDEPATGQDAVEIERLLSAIAQAVAAGKIGAVLFSTHDVRIIARLATRTLVLYDGRLIADGAADEIMANKDLLRRIGMGRATLAAADDGQLMTPRSSKPDLSPRNCA